MNLGKTAIPGVFSLGEVLGPLLDHGLRAVGTVPSSGDESDEGTGGEYRVRSPTRSERMNRALVELETSAFKIHTLLWQWRGAPARGLLPFFTIHSLAKFCKLSRPTVRLGLRELIQKGWISPQRYDKHHKNTLYRLVPIRKVPAPAGCRPDRRGRSVKKTLNRGG